MKEPLSLPPLSNPIPLPQLPPLSRSQAPHAHPSSSAPILMGPAIPAFPALFVPAPTQHRSQLAFQGSEEDEIGGPGFGAGVVGGGEGGVEGRGVAEQELGSWRGAQVAGEPAGWVGVELVGFVEVGEPGWGAGGEVQGGIAAQGPGVDPAVHEVGAPWGGVARGEEADGHCGRGGGQEGGGRGLGQVLGCVLGAEVGEDGERGGLVRACC